MKKTLNKPSKKSDKNLVMLYSMEGGTNGSNCNCTAGC